MHRPSPGGARARLRGQPGITERSAYRTVTYPAEAGYEVNQKNGRVPPRMGCERMSPVQYQDGPWLV